MQSRMHYNVLLTESRYYICINYDIVKKVSSRPLYYNIFLHNTYIDFIILVFVYTKPSSIRWPKLVLLVVVVTYYVAM